ncbi:MAG: hypothetical protein LQ349_006840 [Xanthoria aureola]|nr:MAG: hypothetical protein LQ349_006840 [Xanthoria aureola]
MEEMIVGFVFESQPRQSQSLAFQKAVNEVHHLKVRPTDEEMLELYALYRQGTQDPPFAIAARPGVFDLVGKAKIDAWQNIVDEGVTAEQAQETYAVLVDSLKVKYGFDTR